MTQEVERIQAALDTLLRAIISSPPMSGPARAMTFANIDAYSQLTPASERALDICDDPIGEALRDAVEALGERLNEIGGSNLMREVCQRVADMDEATWGKRTDIIDKRWDGIGDWVS